MDNDRLTRQIDFILEIDRLKQIYRRTRLFDDSRYENDAEHAFHLAMMAIVLAEHSAGSDLDLRKVIEMVLVHDLVEIDVGDTFLYDPDRSQKYEGEKAAAERIFGILPEDQGRYLMELWEEFESRQTPESLFAAALDRLQPILQNYHTQGHAWKKHGITKTQVLEANKVIMEGSPILWEYAKGILDDAERKGYFPS